MSRIRDKVVISGADFVEMDRGRKGLPYLKSVDLVNLTPKHFGLERWKPNIHLSDSWMRKIYAYDHLNDDSDSSINYQQEELDAHQKKVLFDYLTKLYAEEKPCLMRKSRHLPPLEDCLRELLDKRFDDNEDGEIRGGEIRTNGSTSHKSKTTTRSVLDRIELCNKHEFQSEELIVRLALDKMKNLSPEDERKCQKLFRDDEFMSFLNNQVENYLKNSQD